jgi:hypothetical protein
MAISLICHHFFAIVIKSIAILSSIIFSCFDHQGWSSLSFQSFFCHRHQVYCNPVIYHFLLLYSFMRDGHLSHLLLEYFDIFLTLSSSLWQSCHPSFSAVLIIRDGHLSQLLLEYFVICFATVIKSLVILSSIIHDFLSFPFAAVLFWDHVIAPWKHNWPIPDYVRRYLWQQC